MRNNSNISVIGIWRIENEKGKQSQISYHANTAENDTQSESVLSTQYCERSPKLKDVNKDK